MANPQAWNRFSYVSNNPVLFSDPSGNMQEDDNYICHGCTLPPPDSGDVGGDGDDNNSGNDNQCSNDPDCSLSLDNVIDDIIEDYLDGLDSIDQKGCLGRPGSFTVLMNTQKCIDFFANLTQDTATIFSAMGAASTLLTTIIGCVAGVLAAELGCAGGYVLGAGLHTFFYNYFETAFSTTSFILTAYSDFLTQDTYFNSLHDWDLGEDTKTGFATWFAGSLTSEPFIDVGIDVYNSGYNHSYFVGFLQFWIVSRS